MRVSIRNLIDYITKGGASPAVPWIGARNMVLGDELAVWKEEMVAVAAVSRRSAMPVDHWMLSWQEGEQPSRDQIEEAVSILMEELGVTEHQLVWAVHTDTRNVHLHVALNRVHPEHEVCADLKFDYDMGARAIAKIEHRQGWKPQAAALYRADATGRVEPIVQAGTKNGPRQRAQTLERRTGASSAERQAIERAAPVIAAASNWLALHRGLAELGMRYERRGSGAVILVGDIAVKASAVSRGASLKAMEKRLGDYSPPPSWPRLDGAARPRRTAPKSLPGVPLSWADYMLSRIRRMDRTRAMKRRHAAEQAKLRSAHDVERKALLDQRPWGQRLARKRSVLRKLSEDQAVAWAAMRDAQRAELATLRQQMPPLPSFDVWLAEHGYSADADRWRYRGAQVLIEPLGDREDQLPVDCPAGYVARPTEDQSVSYSREEAPDIPVILDEGKRIRVLSPDDEDAIRVAILMGMERWGVDGIRVTGPPAVVSVGQRIIDEVANQAAHRPSPARGLGM